MRGCPHWDPEADLDAKASAHFWIGKLDVDLVAELERIAKGGGGPSLLYRCRPAMGSGLRPEPVDDPASKGV
jgi:hypothetical protein